MKEEVGRMKGETGGAEDAEGKAGHSRVCETGRQGDQMGDDGRGSGKMRLFAWTRKGAGYSAEVQTERLAQAAALRLAGTRLFACRSATGKHRS